MNEDDALNRIIRLYVVLLAGATIGLAIVFAAWETTHVDGRQWLASILIAIAIGGAQRYPVHLSAKTKVYVDTAFITAAALMLPPPLALLTVAVPTALHEARQRVSWEQGLFNLAQTSFYVFAGSFVAHAVSGTPDRIAMASGRDVVAMLAGVSVMHVANTAAVAAVVALQLSRQPRDVWRESILIDLPEHTVLVANGVLLALVTANYPWLLPLFLGPLVLIYLSLVRRTELRQAPESIIDAISELTDALGGEKPGHSRRVADLTRLLALKLGLPASEINAAVIAAHLHGLGAPGSDAQRADGNGGTLPITQRDVAGSRPFLRDNRLGVTAPEENPLQARIIAVADAFERLTSIGGPTIDHDEGHAIAALESSPIREWDPQLIDELSQIVASGTGNGASAAD
jgi:hypothetical protein